MKYAGVPFCYLIAVCVLNGCALNFSDLRHLLGSQTVNRLSKQHDNISGIDNPDALVCIDLPHRFQDVPLNRIPRYTKDSRDALLPDPRDDPLRYNRCRINKRLTRTHSAALKIPSVAGVLGILNLF